MPIPPFQPDGNLPPGIHRATWEEFEGHFGWNPRRRDLLRGLRAAIESLRAAGCRRVFVDGSFVTAKEIPGDFDACWDPRHADPDRLDPVLIEEWGFRDGRAAQKAKFAGELFVMDWDADGQGTTFLDFFQIDKRTGSPKGIIELDPTGLP